MIFREISLITIHVGFNFGSVLQTLATYRVLTKYARTVQVVNYRPQRVTIKYYFCHFKNLKEYIYKIILFPVYLINRFIYTRILKKYVNLTTPVYSIKQLRALSLKSDLFVTGGDQVWNSIHNQGIDVAYYWGFLDDSAIMIALSSSFGRDELFPDEYEYAKNRLKKYKMISVREATGKKIVESMGLKATHLFDPTFFLSKEQWQVYMPSRRIKDNYLLVYIPYNIVSKKEIYKKARWISKTRNLKIIAFSWTHKKESYADYTIRFASPLDFLGLMNEADYIITNSFHGTAFSIILNKQFCVYKPSHFVNRIESLLDSCKLRDRLIVSKISEDDVLKSIDYEIVNKILDTERKKAFNFLDEAIQKCI